MTIEQRRKISETLKRKGFRPPSMRGRKQKPRSKEHCKKISDSKKGHSVSAETRLKISNSIKGRKLSDETKKKIGLANKGEKSHLWKGGVTESHQLIRSSTEYKLWRKSVFERDDYTCIWCGAKNGGGRTVILQADHIKPFALYPELRFAIDNGRTLCRECHRTTETYGRPKKTL